tara:strand:+ start:164 stop:1411 length:1248 start_codon:yes stop_codon:yes gene_type:complete
MPSTYTDNGGIELPANGEQSSTWGNTINDNMNIIDRLTNGVGAITLSGTTHTLTTSDGTPSDGHYKVLVLGGSPSGTNTITVSPNNGQHIYIVKNDSGQTATFTQGSGANVNVLTATSKIIYCDGAGSGAAVVDITGSLDLGPLVVTGTTVTATGAELNILDGVTATTAELNIMDGVTATTAELNIMDGVTSSTAEINKLDGFTGVVADLNYAKDLRATGVTTSEFNVLDGITATTAELNIMDGVTATTAEINYVDGVTSNVQTQINTKAANTTQAASVWETGTNTTETIVSPAKVKAAIEAVPFWDYTSSYLSIGSGNSIQTVTHSLGYIPSLMQMEIKCVSAELGFAVNDTVQMSGHSNMRGAQFGLMLSTDASNTNIVKLAIGSAFTILNASNGTESNITKSSWNVRVRLKK